ncbi:YdcF family protein [Nocardia yunnanensis]|uniref:YdcF family protein n=1 Tax=Nocardia yunnanensis TaxID=2382165 RepID=A0A386ZIS6_9NOCA|nr:YdcF family protein [Nocardia yunnanensis]AYF77396.1 YdcF family protein [Nocardia yunnanensis]
MPTTTLPAEYRSDVETLWGYNQMHHEPRPVDVSIGLGGHDFGVATYTADLYRAGTFPLIVFTGANAPTTVDRFPRGEAVQFRERAIELGVPADAILVEPNATNTGDNIDFTRTLLSERGYLDSIKAVMLISRPYQQRRSYAICRKRWPEVDVVCGSLPLALDDYVAGIGGLGQSGLTRGAGYGLIRALPASDRGVGAGQDRMKASRSALMVAASVVGMPCGKPG